MSPDQRRPQRPRRIVVKLGTSTITGDLGEPERARIKRISDQVADVFSHGAEVVIVSSGAIAAGLRPLGYDQRPSDMPSLQAAAAVGQRRLMDLYADLLGIHDIITAQVLLTQYDIVQRRHYLNARNTLNRLLKLNCVPIVNENDTVAVEEIRYGDNDRLAALVANIISADLLVILSDVEGLFTQNPRKEDAKLIETVSDFTPDLMVRTVGRSTLGSGGMSSKVEAARMATLSGVPVVIARGDRKSVLRDVWDGKNVGTYFVPRRTKVPAKKLWIAWAPRVHGRLVIDGGAVSALVKGKKSLLAAGVRAVHGKFEAGDAVEVADTDGGVVAKGLVAFDSEQLHEIAGTRANREVIHRDLMVIL